MARAQNATEFDLQQVHFSTFLHEQNSFYFFHLLFQRILNSKRILLD